MDIPIIIYNTLIRSCVYTFLGQMYNWECIIAHHDCIVAWSTNTLVAYDTVCDFQAHCIHFIEQLFAQGEFPIYEFIGIELTRYSIYQKSKQNRYNSRKSETMSWWSLKKKIYINSSSIVVFEEETLEKRSNVLHILHKYCMQIILVEHIFTYRICHHISECDSSRRVKIDSTICFYWKFLFDSQGTHSLRYIGSPSQYCIAIQYHVMRVKKLLICRIKYFLQLGRVHFSFIIFRIILSTSNVIDHRI